MGEKHGLGNFRKPPGHPMPELASLQPPQLCGQSPILPMVRALKHSWSQSVSLVAQSCPTLCDSMDCSMPGFPVHHHLPEPTQIVSIVLMSSNHLILCRPLLLPRIPPSIRVFSNESTLRMRWPKYWSFSFSIIPSKETPGLISFRMDRLDLLAA